MKLKNAPTWVPEVTVELERGREAYRKAAEIIVAAIAADKKLTQAKVAEYIEMSPGWVSRLLKWKRDGYPVEGVFAAESAGRRLRRRNPWLESRDGQMEIDASKEPNTTAVVKALKTSEVFVEAVVNVSGENIDGVYKWSEPERLRTLESLAKNLRDAIAAADSILTLLNPVLEELRPPPEFDAPQETEPDPSMVPF